ncbi:MAG TPA: hypothetical protein VH142_24475 [Polyangiaceae bacterium]|nr:hypothetical protein [Polyangiaceae bacterium]
MSRPPFDSQFEREESQSRVRPANAGEVPKRSASGTYEAYRSEPPSSTGARREGIIAERTARIEHKVELGTMLLAKLNPLDSRARLLASAILRRDEVLLDGVLDQLGAALADLIPKDSTR